MTDSWPMQVGRTLTITRPAGTVVASAALEKYHERDAKCGRATGCWGPARPAKHGMQTASMGKNADVPVADALNVTRFRRPIPIPSAPRLN